MSTATLPKVKALAGWFGANRILAARVGESMVGSDAVFIPFAGGMSELLYIDARTILVNDKHAAMINLARIAGDPVLGPQLYRRLRRRPFCLSELESAQRTCKLKEEAIYNPLFCAGDVIDPIEWAEAYFICCWMGRGGNAGTAKEFDGGLSMRFDGNGGDSATRYFSAANSLVAWRRRVLWRCTFTELDAFEFLTKVRDIDGNTIYSDAPWPGPGDGYKHRFGHDEQCRLAKVLASFNKARVVIRFGDHPTIRELYPSSIWTITEQTSRAQSNGDVQELLIVSRRAS